MHSNQPLAKALVRDGASAVPSSARANRGGVATLAATLLAILALAAGTLAGSAEASDCPMPTGNGHWLQVCLPATE